MVSPTIIKFSVQEYSQETITYKIKSKALALTSKGKPTTSAPAALTTIAEVVKATELRASETIPMA